MSTPSCLKCTLPMSRLASEPERFTNSRELALASIFFFFSLPWAFDEGLLFCANEKKGISKKKNVKKMSGEILFKEVGCPECRICLSFQQISSHYFFLAEECLRTVGADRNNGDGHIHFLLDVFDIIEQFFRKIILRRKFCKVLVPSFQVLVNRLHKRRRYVIRKLFSLSSVVAIMRAYFYRFKNAEHIRFHHDKFCNPIDHDGEFKSGQIEPAAPARATCSGTEFISLLAHALACFIEQLGGEWSAAHARAIRFKNSDHIADAVGRNSQSRAGACAHGVG